MTEAVFRERLQAIIDWADLAMKNRAEFDSHGVRNLDGPVFDAAREALSVPPANTSPETQIWGDMQAVDCVLSIGSSSVCAHGTLGCVNHHAQIAEWEREEKLTIEQAWTILCETPDITSPEEYPDHALITMEQLGSFMARGQTAVPEGWKLCPRTPTDAMMMAGLNQASHDSEWSDVYSAWVDMVDAAPEVPHE